MADSACPSRAGGAEGCPRGLATLQLLSVFTVADAVAAVVVIKAMELVGLVSRMP